MYSVVFVSMALAMTTCVCDVSARQRERLSFVELDGERFPTAPLDQDVGLMVTPFALMYVTGADATWDPPTRPIVIDGHASPDCEFIDGIESGTRLVEDRVVFVEEYEHLPDAVGSCNLGALIKLLSIEGKAASVVTIMTAEHVNRTSALHGLDFLDMHLDDVSWDSISELTGSSDIGTTAASLYATSVVANQNVLREKLRPILPGTVPGLIVSEWGCYVRLFFVCVCRGSRVRSPLSLC